MSLTPQRAAIVRTISRAAAAGLPCPMNAELAERTGLSTGAVSHHMSRLAAAGVLNVERTGPNTRVVTIVETGKRTRA